MKRSSTPEKVAAAAVSAARLELATQLRKLDDIAERLSR